MDAIATSWRKQHAKRPELAIAATAGGVIPAGGAGPDVHDSASLSETRAARLRALALRSNPFVGSFKLARTRVRLRPLR